jgi:hypothetical protein
MWNSKVASWTIGGGKLEGGSGQVVKSLSGKVVKRDNGKIVNWRGG